MCATRTGIPRRTSGPAFVDEIQVTEGFTDVNSASRKILSGESQVNGDILPEPEGLKLAAQDYPDQLQMVPGTGNRYISLNTTVPPLDDLNVRKAVLAAADRERFGSSVAARSSARSRRTSSSRRCPGSKRRAAWRATRISISSRDPTGDPELAAEYFRKAGYESGKYEGDDEILVVAENAGVDKRVGEAVNDLFEELGFNVTFREVSGRHDVTKFCPRPEADVAVCPNAAG